MTVDATELPALSTLVPEHLQVFREVHRGRKELEAPVVIVDRTEPQPGTLVLFLSLLCDLGGVLAPSGRLSLA